MAWDERAECARRGRDGKPFYDAELWQPIGTTGSSVPQIEDATRICRRCTVRAECLDYALRLPVEFGILGGLTEDERRSLKRRQSRARAKERGEDEVRPPVRSDLLPIAQATEVIEGSGLTNREIAARTGMHEDTVSRLRRKTGEWVEPTTLARLERGLAAVTS